jgi:hypothetical protein
VLTAELVEPTPAPLYHPPQQSQLTNSAGSLALTVTAVTVVVGLGLMAPGLGFLVFVPMVVVLVAALVKRDPGEGQPKGTPKWKYIVATALTTYVTFVTWLLVTAILAMIMFVSAMVDAFNTCCGPIR